MNTVLLSYENSVDLETKSDTNGQQSGTDGLFLDVIPLIWDTHRHPMSEGPRAPWSKRGCVESHRRGTASLCRDNTLDGCILGHNRCIRFYWHVTNNEMNRSNDKNTV